MQIEAKKLHYTSWLMCMEPKKNRVISAPTEATCSFALKGEKEFNYPTRRRRRRKFDEKRKETPIEFNLAAFLWSEERGRHNGKMLDPDLHLWISLERTLFKFNRLLSRKLPTTVVLFPNRAAEMLPRLAKCVRYRRDNQWSIDQWLNLWSSELFSLPDIVMDILQNSATP